MKFETIEVSGWRGALIGARNPMDSWERSDTAFNSGEPFIGHNDMNLLQSLLSAGTSHSKFMRMIHVQVQTDMPRYWWSEADTYHFGTKNSCSTMHKLLNNKNPICGDQFVSCKEDADLLEATISRLESLRRQYRQTKDAMEQDHLLLRAKRILPDGFLQMRMWDTNYAELRNIYFQRVHHRLKEEWQREFCGWVNTLPYSKELITYSGDPN